MTKKNRYKNWSDDLTISGMKWVPDQEQEDPDNPTGKFFIHRSRKSRRAQARIDGLKWRDLSYEERLQQ